MTLADQLHFGRAAQLLNISQPAVSKQIRLLEQEVGGALFVRGRRGAVLTALGALVVEEARSVLQASDQLTTRCRLAVAGEVGTLNLGFGFTALEIVPGAIADFRRLHPGVEIRLADISTADQVQALRSGKIQLGLVRLPVPAEFAQERLMEDRLALVVPQADAARRLSLATMHHAPFVLLARDRAPGFYSHVLRLCAEHGFSPRVVQETNEFHTVLAFVAAGIGAGFVSESFIRSRPVPAGIRAYPLTGRTARWAVGAAWRKGENSVLVRQFVKVLRARSRTTKTRVDAPGEQRGQRGLR
jgi:DNA-binding transcriptional LysR family regulator